MPLLLTAVLWCGVCPAALAAVDKRFDSPRSTMFTFLDAMGRAVQRPSDQQAWRDAVACLPSQAADAGAEAARDTAEQLFLALNHIRKVRPEELPGRANAGPITLFTYFPRRLNEEDRALVEAAGIEHEKIRLKRQPDGAWTFSRLTAGDAQALATKLARVDLKVDPAGKLTRRPWLERWVPASLRQPALLGVRYWQWAALAALFVLAAGVDMLVRLLAGGVLGRLVRRADETERDMVRRAARPLGLLIAAAAVLGGLHAIGLPDNARMVLLTAVRVFLVFAGVWAGWRVLDVLGAWALRQTQRTRTRTDDVFVPLVRKGLKLAVLALGLVYGAKALSIDILPLLTGLGIGSLAFAFAAKDTIENFFGSIAVILDRPFEVGDWVVIGDVEGTVEELGFRSTRVRTFYNSQMTVPNATLVRATVDNYGRRRYRRWKTHLGVQYDTTPDQLIAFTEGIRELVRTHPYTRKDYYQVWTHQWSASSMDVLLYVFFEVPDWNTELRERERLFIDIVRLADQLGVEFAFPTQTVHLQRAGEDAGPGPQLSAPTSMTDRRSLVSGIRAAQQVIAGQPWRHEKPGPQTYGQVGPTPIDEAGNEILDPEVPERPNPPHTTDPPVE